MSGRDIVLTGVPRSGTTLCCQLVGRAADTVALFEPMEVDTLPQARIAAVAAIAGFFEASRDSLRDEGWAWSQQVGGTVPDNPFGEGLQPDGSRRREAERGRIAAGKPLTQRFTLAIKHNAAFAALLPELSLRFEAVAFVRNPMAVLASWQSVDLPVSRGRLPAGERLDPALAARLDAEPDATARQLAIVDWFFSRYAEHLPSERVLAYEDVVAGDGAALGAALGLALPRTPLRGRNANRMYRRDACAKLAERLLRDRGAWRRWYGDRDVEAVMRQLDGGAH